MTNFKSKFNQNNITRDLGNNVVVNQKNFNENTIEWNESDYLNFKPSNRFSKQMGEMTEMTKVQKIIIEWEKSQNLPTQLQNIVSQVSFRIGPVIGKESLYFKSLYQLANMHMACKYFNFV